MPQRHKGKRFSAKKARKAGREQPPHWSQTIVLGVRQARARSWAFVQARGRALAGLLMFVLGLLPWIGLAVPALRAVFRAWWGLWGGLSPAWSLGMIWGGARLLLPERVPWNPTRAGGAALLLFALGLWAETSPLHLGGLWGVFGWRILHQALGADAAWVVLLAWTVLGISWVLERPVWDMGWGAARALRLHLWPALRRWGRSMRRRVYRWWVERRATSSVHEPEPLPKPSVRTVRHAAVHAGHAPPAVKPGSRTWTLPDPNEVLPLGEEGGMESQETWLQEQARLIEETLAHFDAPARVVTIQQGPTVTLFGVEPGYVETRRGPVRVRVSKILALADDLALALAAKRIRIQAPVPGRPYIGIEVPNETPRLVPLRRVISSPAFSKLRAALPLALGEDVSGQPVVAALEAMPHLLIAGTTGAGKSVCLHAMLTTWLLFRTPDELRLLLLDPKRVELTIYSGIPHLLAPVVTDLERAQGALQWAIREMERRYHLLAHAGVRDIAEYNASTAAHEGKPLPYVAIVIDELADLMMLAPQKTEQALIRLAQLARATGVHLVVATQRPSVDVVTGLIKANFPARIAFAVASSVDSRVILDRPGAERLLGRGDMLFLPPDAPEPLRVQGSWVTMDEVRRVVQHWQAQGGIRYGHTDAPASPLPLRKLEAEAHPQDPLWDQALAVLQEEGYVSITLLQRRLGIGYTRAARIYEQMQARGLLPPSPASDAPYNEADTPQA